MSYQTYQNQKFVYKKTVSAKDSLKCCVLAGEGGKPGNEARTKLLFEHKL